MLSKKSLLRGLAEITLERSDYSPKTKVLKKPNIKSGVTL